MSQNSEEELMNLKSDENVEEIVQSQNAAKAQLNGPEFQSPKEKNNKFDQILDKINSDSNKKEPDQQN